MNRRGFSIAMLCIVAIAMATFGALVLAQKKPTPTATPQPTTSSPTPAKPAMISLPGATPFAPVAGDVTADSHIWKIVSKQQSFTNPRYVPSDIKLATVPTRADKPVEERSLRADIMPSVEALFAAGKAAGHNLIIGSGYRTYDQQAAYFASYSAAYGEAKAATFSARPGHSEHQSGLAFDIATADRTCYLEQCFATTPAGKWVAAHAHEYGFIVRYPDVPGSDYMYEPWHLRYVGRDLATALHTIGMTLDTAAPYLKKPTTE